MVNYNLEEPKERGFWYDCCVTNLKKGRSTKQLICTIFVWADPVLENCKIIFLDEIFAIEKTITLMDQISESKNSPIAPRGKMPNCTHCNDIPNKKCKICSCHICGEDDWYCPECKNDETEVVRAGEKLKASNAPLFRLITLDPFQVLKSALCGSFEFKFLKVVFIDLMLLAFMVVKMMEPIPLYLLYGGYEDDLDEGEEFKYTGSGARDLSGNKQCAEQSCDQILSRMNKALASNCNVAINKNGAEAKDWKAGKPVRMVRNCKGRKHSEFCPEEGNRYDGIYK
ncbi:e3 ubiquitin-protein ligase UHRF1, partial [Caerostris darwini]